MTHFSVVKQTYADAWSRRRMFITIQVILQVVAWAVIAPVMAVLISLTVSLSDQSALTDQDIAMFLLTPGGFIATVGVVAVLLVVSVWGFAMMAAVFRTGPMGSLQSTRRALFAVSRRAQFLLIFAVLLVLRVLVIVLPFVGVGLLVAKRNMTEFDINYYLTFHPPEFLIAVAIIAGLGLVMAVFLLRALTGWALALHLVVFGDVRPRDAFRLSAERMEGRRKRLAIELVIWLAVRLAIAAALGLVAGLVLNLVPLTPGSGLKLALIISVIVVGVWMLGLMILAAVSLGALARLIDGFYEDATPLDPLPAGVAISLKRRLVLVGSVGLVLAGGAGWGVKLMMDQLQTEDHVEIIAHRGAAGARPENTMASFAKAIEDRTDWIELDVQETRDGDVIVVHDSDFMKLAEVDLKVWDSDLGTLADVDIGSWYDAAYNDQRTPLLRDVLALAKGKAKVLIELKYYGHDMRLEQSVAEIVEDMGMVDQIATMSLKYQQVQKMLELRPDWRTGVLAATAVGDLAGLDGNFVAVSTATIGPRLIDAVHAAGKDIYVWTVNDPLQMSRMISLGVDGLITDEPALVHQVLAVRAGLSTPERLILLFSEALGLKLNPKEYRDDQP